MAVPLLFHVGDTSHLSPLSKPRRPDRCLASRGPRRRPLAPELSTAPLARALACDPLPATSHPEGERHVEA